MDTQASSPTQDSNGGIRGHVAARDHRDDPLARFHAAFPASSAAVAAAPAGSHASSARV